VELTLLGTTGLIAFLVVGGAIMLISAFRRTIALRNALAAAMERIERLEGQVANGLPAVAAPAPRREVPVEPPAPMLEAPAPPKEAPPPPSPPPPIIERAAVEQAPLRAAEAERGAPDAAPAGAGVAPPGFGLIAFIGALATFAVLAAAHEGAYDGAIGVALALVVGLAVLAAAEWRRSVERIDVTLPHAPDQSALAAMFGLGVMLVGLLYGRYALGAPAPLGAFLGVAAAALAAALLTLRYGAWLMVFAILAAVAAPGFAPADAAGGLARYGFLAAFAMLAMALSRQRQAPLWAWIGAAIALGWGVAAFGLDRPELAAASAVFFTALAACGIAYAWRGGAPSPSYPIFWSNGASWPEPKIVGHALFVLAGACVGGVLLTKDAPTPVANASLATFCAIAAGAAMLRPGLWLAPFFAALVGAGVLALWPAGADGLVNAPSLVTLAAMLGFVFSFGGGLMLLRARDSNPGATLAALAPIGVFSALHWRIGAAFGAPPLWAAAALIIAGLNAVCYLQLAKARQGAATPFAAGAALGVALAAYAITPAPYAPLALALAIPLCALIDRWRKEPGLRYAAIALCALLFIRVIGPQLFVVTATGAQVLALHLLPSAIAAFAAAWLFERGAAGPRSRAAQYPFALGLVLIACLATLALRHEFTAGDIGAPYASLIEMGANTMIWLALAGLIALRFGPRPRASIFALEFLAFAGAATHELVAGLLMINPWWGLVPADAPGARGLNAIEFGYAAPALLFLGYAYLRARQRLAARAMAAAGVGVALLFAALMLELRRLFHGAAMASAPVSSSEAWTYSIAALGFAAILMALSMERAARGLRYAALGLALLAVGKMAFFDLSGLDGLPRVAATVGFIIAAGVMTVLYRRFALPDGPARFKQDPNLMPPR
jgi:uncharacterized membrane protein